MRPDTHTLHSPRGADAGLVLGIDPGLQRTGYALVRMLGPFDQWELCEAGVIRLDRRRSLPERLVDLEVNLAAILQQHAPPVLACEELYAHYRHPRTAILMGHARGVILALAQRRGLQVLSISATHAKKLLTGRGHAAKAQVQRAVAISLHLAQVPEPHDVADAIAVALAGQIALRAEALLSGVEA